MRTLKIAQVSLAILFCANSVGAQVYSIDPPLPTLPTAALNWNSATTWSSGAVPGADDDVVIRHAVFANSGSLLAQSVNIINDNGVTASLTLSSTAMLTVGAGGMTVTGGSNIFNSDLLLNNNAVVTINGDLTFTSSQFDEVLPGPPPVTNAHTSALRLNASSRLQVNGSFTYTHTPSAAETRPEVAINTNSNLTVAGSITLEYNSTSNSELQFYIENSATVNVNGNVSLTMTEAGTSGRVSFLFGSSSSNATCSMEIGGDLNMNNNDITGVASVTRTVLDTRDNSNLKIYGDINMRVLQANAVSNSNRLRVFDESRLTLGGESSDMLYNAAGGDLNFISNTTSGIDFGNRVVVGNLYTAPNPDRASTSIFDINGNVLYNGSFADATNPVQGRIDMDNINGNSSFYFSGAKPQVIPRVNNANDFANMLIDNSSGILLTLDVSASIMNSLTMMNGIIDSGAPDLFEFGAAATCAGGTATSYIVNGVTKYGGGTITLPLGAGTHWAPLELSNIVGANPFFSIFQANYTPDTHAITATDGTFDHRSGAEYWNLQFVGDINWIPTLDATFHWKDACFSEIEDVSVTPQDLFIGGLVPASRWELIGSSQILGGSQSCNDGDIAFESGGVSVSLTAANLASYTHYTFVAIDPFLNSLPVELVSFNVNAYESMALITWETASELNNWKFVIQKSFDGKNWSEVTGVNGLGTSNAGKEYSAIDLNPYAGTSYYRLVQYDFDGTLTYSPIRSLTMKGEDKLIVTMYPNPSTDVLQISTTDFLDNVVIQIYDATGAVLMTKAFPDFGRKQVLDVQFLRTGRYLVSLSCNGRRLDSKPIIVIK